MTTQLHDFNPGITPNGVFWIVQVPDDAVQITGNTLIVRLENVAVVDQLHFPGGTGNAPVTLSFHATYTKSGKARKVQPISHDPLSPFNWAGEMWEATNSGSFSAVYGDGSFSAQGTFSSSGNFGEMGTERNGSFVEPEEASAVADTSQRPQTTGTEASQGSDGARALRNLPLFKGRVPIMALTR